MKVLFLASVFTAAMVPFAAAAETDAPCQLEEDRRVPQVRINTDAPGGSAPAAPVARQTNAPRSASDAQVAQREADAAARAFAERRRSGKRIPDAELIGPRGAL